MGHNISFELNYPNTSGNILDNEKDDTGHEWNEDDENKKLLEDCNWMVGSSSGSSSNIPTQTSPYIPNVPKIPENS